MLIAISNNDMILAAAQLDAFTKVNPKFGNQIKAYIKDDFNQIRYISQLTYVSKGIQNKKEVSQKDYNTARKVVIAAEDRLAPGSVNTRTEAIFRNTLKHTPTQIASLPAYAGQALSVSVYATPANATHRIDKYQGSIPVGGEVVPLDMTTEARQISRIIGDHTTMIEAQRTRLNKELFAGADTVTSADYLNMLRTGSVPTALTTAGLSFVSGKGPKFFEARAMILGSICANKTEGIGYPQFIRVTNVPGSPAVTRTETTPEISQMEPPTNSMSQGGYTGENIATVTEIGLGIGIAKKPTPEQKPPDKPIEDGPKPKPEPPVQPTPTP